MNKVFLIGRLVRNPEVRYSQSEPPIAVAKYSLAVPRKIKRQNEQDCDFINCVAFGKAGEFAEKYLHKGIKNRRYWAHTDRKLHQQGRG